MIDKNGSSSGCRRVLSRFWIIFFFYECLPIFAVFENVWSLEGIDVGENFSRDILKSGYCISQVISSFLSSRIQPRNSILIVIQIVTNFPISICIIQHEARTPRGVTSPVLHRTHPPSLSTLERRWSYFERNKRFARFDYKLRRIYDERWKGIRDRRRTGRGCLKATAFR